MRSCRQEDTTLGADMNRTSVVDALATGHVDAAKAIAFEYLALTQGEAGVEVPQGIADLPPSLRAVMETLEERHREPATLLLAISTDEVCGCVGMTPSVLTAPTDALVQRLYVRAAHRRQGIARALMQAVHSHAERHGFSRVVLNVMPSRTGAIAFYRALGYQPIPDVAQWPYPAVWLAYDLHPHEGPDTAVTS